jgi:hypothetical protein
MSKVNAILNERLKHNDAQPKMAALAKKSAEGGLTSFSGIFGFAELSDSEKEGLKALLERYADEGHDISFDFTALSSITSEVKAINNQAAILHGERIKRAQNIFKKYRDGAFTAWLIATYGNRQTPYNFLQYYEFYETMPKKLHVLIDAMPRQAVYTLASRNGPIEQKEAIIHHSIGKTKQELLEHIRKVFPLEKDDKRSQSPADAAIQLLQRIRHQLKQSPCRYSDSQRKTIRQLLNQINEIVNGPFPGM